MIIDNQAVQRAFQRLLAITWKEKFVRHYSEMALIKEYLRRSALWIDALHLDPSKTGPFWNIPAQLVPEVVIPQPLVDQLSEHIQAPSIVQGICIQYLHWVAVEDYPKVSKLSLPAPYEPLIRLFERGGILQRGPAGSIDVVGGAVMLNNWYTAARNRPSIALDDASLDAIDAADPYKSV